jgi:hypothetical protein
MFLCGGVVGGVWNDGVRACGFSVYRNVDMVVLSLYCNVKKVNIVVMFCFIRELHVGV